MSTRDTTLGAKWRLWLVLLSVGLLTACGFHLRGPQPLPFKTIYLDMPGQADMSAALRRQILVSGSTAVVDRVEDAQVVFKVLLNVRDKSILSLNAAGRVREFRLRQRLGFQLVDAQNRALTPAVDLSVNRDLSFSDTASLAKDAEEAQLYKDMQSDLIQQILRRLAVVRVE